MRKCREEHDSATPQLPREREVTFVFGATTMQRRCNTPTTVCALVNGWAQCSDLMGNVHSTSRRSPIQTSHLSRCDMWHVICILLANYVNLFGFAGCWMASDRQHEWQNADCFGSNEWCSVRLVKFLQFSFRIFIRRRTILLILTVHWTVATGLWGFGSKRLCWNRQHGSASSGGCH